MAGTKDSLLEMLTSIIRKINIFTPEKAPEGRRISHRENRNSETHQKQPAEPIPRKVHVDFNSFRTKKSISAVTVPGIIKQRTKWAICNESLQLGVEQSKIIEF